jgi:citrate synthase
MTQIAAIPAPGLENIIVAETTLSHVDGQKGELILRGKAIDDIAGKQSFEEAVCHLWKGLLLPSQTNLTPAFGAARLKAFQAVEQLAPLAKELSVIDWMRLGLDSLLISEDESASPTNAIELTAALAVFLTAASRLKQGQTPIAPDPEAGFSKDLLFMLHGSEPDKEAIDALDRYLVTILDHGLNASTFTARVVASTRSDMRSCLSAAIGALKGPLHGGAPGPVLDMIEDIGEPKKADRWIEQELNAGNRLMGFGHRVYRVRDPRADVLKAGLKSLAHLTDRIEKAQAIEQAALKALKRHKPDRALDTNVEFYTAVLLDAIGFDRTLFTPLFAVGRSAGWAAHVIEQQSAGKLIRPQSRYIGPSI